MIFMIYDLLKFLLGIILTNILLQNLRKFDFFNLTDFINEQKKKKKEKVGGEYYQVDLKIFQQQKKKKTLKYFKLVCFHLFSRQLLKTRSVVRATEKSK